MNGNARLSPPTECSARSVMRALDDFLGAARAMRETVLVPSRLRGTEVAVEMRCGGALPRSNGKLVLRNGHNEDFDMDLHCLYVRVREIHQQLVGGFCAGGGDGDEFDDEADEAARVAAGFRRLLLQLFVSLRQMTEAANYLSKHYQDGMDLD